MNPQWPFHLLGKKFSLFFIFPLPDLAALNLNNGSSGASDQDTLAPLPHPAAPWPLGQGYPYQYPLPPPCFPPAYQDPGFSYGSGSAGSQQSEGKLGFGLNFTALIIPPPSAWVPLCCLCLWFLVCSLHGLCATALKSKGFVSLEEWVWLSALCGRFKPVRNGQHWGWCCWKWGKFCADGIRTKHKRKITFFFCKWKVSNQGFPGLKHCCQGGKSLLACDRDSKRILHGLKTCPPPFQPFDSFLKLSR